MILLGSKEVQSHGVVVVVGEEEDGEAEGEDMVVDGDKSPRTISLRLRNKLKNYKFVILLVSNLKLTHIFLFVIKRI